MRALALLHGGVDIQRDGIAGNRAGADIEILLRELADRVDGKPEVAGDDVRPGVRDPIGDGESAELGEVAAIETEQEMTGLVSEALQHVAVALWKIPNVANGEVVGRRGAVGGNDRGAHAAFEHVSPFGGDGMPVQLAETAGIEAHRDAGDALRKRELFDRGFHGCAALPAPAAGRVFDVIDEILQLRFRAGVSRRGGWRRCVLRQSTRGCQSECG